MSDARKRRRRLHRLWRQNPKCRICGVLTKLPEQLRKQYGDRRGNPLAPPAEMDRMATFEHLRSRLNPARGSDNAESTTPLCRRCNNLCGAIECSTVFRDEAKRRTLAGEKGGFRGRPKPKGDSRDWYEFALAAA